MNKQEYGAKRIVCLTEETTKAFYLMGEQDRIVGISGFTVRPAIARKEKPDLVLAFSDMQADISTELVPAEN